jgi:hypothetical protein
MKRAEDEDRLDEAELVRDGGLFYWLGTDQYHIKTAKRLLQCVAIRSGGDLGGCERYSINDVGRAICERPELADEVYETLMRGGSFTITPQHTVQLLPKP